MKELPQDERPYERCIKYGPEALSNTELLSVILKSGYGGKSAYQLAGELLKKYESPHTLADLFFAGINELTKTKGIGCVKAVMLRCVGELCSRISKETASGRITLNSSKSIADYYMESMRHLEQEQIRAAFFDTKCNLIRDVIISTGTVNASIVSPREIFIRALENKAVFVVVLHNHPSGDPSPSGEDLILTNEIKKAGELLKVPLMDHIIIGDNRYVSLKDHGVL